MKLGQIIRNEFPKQTRIVDEISGDIVLQNDHNVLLRMTFLTNYNRVFNKQSLGEFINVLQEEHAKLRD